MSVPADAEVRSAAVERLRAAGCVFAEDEAALIVAEAATPAELEAMVERRVAGLPLEHVVGWADFCGLRIALDPGLFVPRRRTELLVHLGTDLGRRATRAAGSSLPANDPASTNGVAVESWANEDGAAERLASVVPGQAPLVVVDLCCGSGAVGAAVAAALGRIELHAVDVDPAAVRCARRNVAAVDGRVYEGDLYDPLPENLQGRVDVLVANAPYVPTGEIDLLPAEARLHEPQVSLDGGPDGLDILRRVIAEAPEWLAPGGHLLVETSLHQAPEAHDAVVSAGLVPQIVTAEKLGATVVRATHPATAPAVSATGADPDAPRRPS